MTDIERWIDLHEAELHERRHMMNGHLPGSSSNARERTRHE
jgi:hypothetical protein